MSRRAPTITCHEDTEKELEKIARSPSQEQRMVLRAKIILECLSTSSNKEIAAKMGLSIQTISKWRNRFIEDGIEGLKDEHRSGRNRKYDDKSLAILLKTMDTEPPAGLSRWDAETLSKETGISKYAVWRFLKKHGIQLSRTRSWCVSTDPMFAEKSADIVGLYLDPPEDAIVISIDEKPGMQALSRTTGYVKCNNGKIMRALKSTYRRNGTLNLYAALEVSTGILHGRVTKYKKRTDFLEFMDELLTELPSKPETTYHVILDNYCTHKRNSQWLQKHPNVAFHFTPTSASWLNMVEIWFNILERKCLRGSSFNSTSELKEAVENFINHYNTHDAHPFIWRKREVKGSQIKNTIANLCN